MSKSSRSQPAAGKKSCCCLSMRCLSIIAVFLALFTALYSYLDARLDQFYIFDQEHLHDLSQRAIAAHGNDTRGVVDYIVAELDQKVPSQYVNKEEQWVFNNAGGAMGAMYIIHASTFLLSLLYLVLLFCVVHVSMERMAGGRGTSLAFPWINWLISHLKVSPST